jgi:predicted RNase H-like HicB family nuclease
MRTYAVVFERGGENEENWGAWVPDLPGCISTGDTLEEAKENIRDAIDLHIRGMIEDGEPVPEPSVVELVDVAA